MDHRTNGGYMIAVRTVHEAPQEKNGKPQKQALRSTVRFGAIGIALGIILGLSTPAFAATTTYHNASVTTNVNKSSPTANVKGGTVEGVIGGRASAVIQTLSVFGAVNQESVASKGTYTIMSHRVYFDGKSRCHWYNWDASTPSSSQWLTCRVTT